jgi:hypothetical protein
MAQDYVLLTASASARELGFLVPPSDATKGRIPLSPRGEFLLPPLGDWKISLPLMSDNFPRGVVLFEPLSNRTTEITLRLRSSIESATLAKVTRDYLTNFKRVPERTSTP